MVLNYIWIAFFALAFVVAAVRLIFFGDTEIFPAMKRNKGLSHEKPLRYSIFKCFQTKVRGLLASRTCIQVLVTEQHRSA